jgi:mRNA interferase RelE/StbE
MPDHPVVPAPRNPPPSRYSIEWQPAAERVLRKLDKPGARRLVASITALATDPRPSGVKALTGLPGALRLRVGDYRVVYMVEDHRLLVLVVTLGHRREIYRNL